MILEIIITIIVPELGFMEIVMETVIREVINLVGIQHLIKGLRRI